MVMVMVICSALVRSPTNLPHSLVASASRASRVDIIRQVEGSSLTSHVDTTADCQGCREVYDAQAILKRVTVLKQTDVA